MKQIYSEPPIPELVLVPEPISPNIEPEPQQLNFPMWLLRPLPIIPLFVMTIIAALISSQIGGVGLFLTLAILIAIAGWGYRKTYPFRLKQYQNAQEPWQRWEAQKRRILSQYAQDVEECQQENDHRKQEHQEQINRLHSPSYVTQWKNQQLQERFRQLQPYQLGNPVDIQIFDSRGYAEYPDNCIFPTLLQTYFGNQISVLRYLDGVKRIPDFAYIDQARNLYIDIEIDEPYTPRQYPNSNKPLRVTHGIDQPEYVQRDDDFTSRHWIVIHFSERQVLLQPHSCCKAIAILINNLTQEQDILNQFVGIPELIAEPCWTEAQARRMAQNRERLNYS